jgi:hypothetical protein
MESEGRRNLREQGREFFAKRKDGGPRSKDEAFMMRHPSLVKLERLMLDKQFLRKSNKEIVVYKGDEDDMSLDSGNNKEQFETTKEGVQERDLAEEYRKQRTMKGLGTIEEVEEMLEDGDALFDSDKTIRTEQRSRAQDRNYEEMQQMNKLLQQKLNEQKESMNMIGEILYKLQNFLRENEGGLEEAPKEDNKPADNAAFDFFKCISTIKAKRQSSAMSNEQLNSFLTN